ncbi:MAG TPA: thymidine phosphorylase [Pyrinomonadaceae bacterium]|nr:thymidine phosphorylase [Pyrinomonadaceae bacterium]
MRPQEIIATKRDGKSLSDAEITSFIDGVVDGSWADYQISALVMAIFIRGLNRREQHSITSAMLHSGTIMDFSDVEAPKGDKHSTGGVGDKTSLMIAPLAAACGVAVPMISGRGLGHTGGTLDKLQSIPGYNVNLTFPQFKKVLKACGFALGGQTKHIAPADKKIYALRDATATVPYIPMIVASIMSKKLAEGLDALVLDVKTGSGAFIQKYADSLKLAKALCETGRSFSVNTQAVVTDMSQPLGKYVGNAVEVYECLKILRGEGDDLMGPTLELSIELTANLLVQCRLAGSLQTGRSMSQRALDSGAALERFRQNVELQGGDPTVCDRPEMMLGKGLKETVVTAPTGGYVAEIDTFAIGGAICEIGGGRLMAEDAVDHAVGFATLKKIGDRVHPGDELGIAYYRRKNHAELIGQKILAAYKISKETPRTTKLIRAVV